MGKILHYLLFIYSKRNRKRERKKYIKKEREKEKRKYRGGGISQK